MRYLFLILLFFSTIVIGYAEESKINIYEGEGYLLKYPKEVVLVTNSSQMMDFYILTFKYREKSILKAYIGNHPEIVKDIDKQVITKNNLVFNVFATKNEDKTENKNVYVELSKSKWPTIIHFWYSNLDSSLSDMSNSIIFSTERL